MNRPLDWLLRRLYGAYVSEPARNSLRAHLTLLQRDREPLRAAAPITRRLTVLAPHMDDEVFGCGGTLAAASAGGTEVTVVYLTDGSKGYEKRSSPAPDAAETARFERALVEERKTEARRAGKILGFGEPVFLDLPDGALAVTPEAVARLRDALEALAPDTVFLPFVTDIHHDHWLTNSVFIEAATALGLPSATPCWGYEVWIPLPANTVVDITEAFPFKHRAMEVFESQRSEFDYRRAITALNTHRSLFTDHGRGFAEGFWVADFGLYRALYRAITVGGGLDGPLPSD